MLLCVFSNLSNNSETGAISSVSKIRNLRFRDIRQLAQGKAKGKQEVRMFCSERLLPNAKPLLSSLHAATCTVRERGHLGAQST